MLNIDFAYPLGILVKKRVKMAENLSSYILYEIMSIIVSLLLHKKDHTICVSQMYVLFMQ